MVTCAKANVSFRVLVETRGRSDILLKGWLSAPPHPQVKCGSFLSFNKTGLYYLEYMFAC